MAVIGIAIGAGAWLWPDLNDPDKVSSGAERASYIAMVDALCQTALSEWQEMAPQLQTADPAVASQQFEKMSMIYGNLLTSWSSLDPPVRGDLPALRTQLDALERMIRALQDAIVAFQLSDPEILREALADALDDMDESGNEFRQESRAWGLRVCPTLGS